VLKFEKVVGEMFSMKGDMLNVSYAKKGTTCTKPKQQP
jgi:hypothetical protein